MKRAFCGLLLGAILLSGCAGTGMGVSLWGLSGTPTPTPLFIPPTPVPTATPFQPTFPTAQPLPTATPLATSEVSTAPDETVRVYVTQPGDWLPAVAARFGVAVEEIRSASVLPPGGFLPPQVTLLMPNRLTDYGPTDFILPDSEFVESPSSIGFDVAAYVRQAGGKLSDYREYLGSTGWTDGANEIVRICRENSLNPRLILALLDYESNWVRGQPRSIAEEDYPLGHRVYESRGLFRQMMWAADVLSHGYYGWRSGTLLSVTTADGVTVRLSPDLNAATAALQYYFAQTRTYDAWLQAVDGESGFAAFYREMFGDPWERAAQVEPLVPAMLQQPPMRLPFGEDESWSLTGGPHAAWEKYGAWAALDFAPPQATQGCAISEHWARAIAPGLVVRDETGLLVLDMDGDGYEQTGWNVLYLHIATSGRQVHLGDWVNAGDLIGHPSCEGGVSTGTHLHIARKYNGEWMLADGPVPFNLDGWVAHNGSAAYKGSLTRGEQTVIASQVGSYESRIPGSTP